MKPGLNMGGPPSKPKYSLTTDSESVTRVNDEKFPDKGSETVPETACLQAVGVRLWRMTACLLHNEPTSYSL